MPARKLTPDEFHSSAESALWSVFKSLDFKGEPFRDEVEQKLILDMVGFWLDEEQFRSVCEAARGVGDEILFYSMVRGYTGGAELIPHYTWEIPLWDYEVYCDAEDEPINREHDIGIPLDRVLYSPSGKWGILLPDESALVGGSENFVRRFKDEYPAWPDDLTAFVARRLKAARERGVDVTWVPGLLRHMYGDEAPPFEP
jgi:hypothetical protein